jgi:hypothetical protein
MKYRVRKPMFASQFGINSFDINNRYSLLVCYDAEFYSPSRMGEAHMVSVKRVYEPAVLDGVRVRVERLCYDSDSVGRRDSSLVGPRMSIATINRGRESVSASTTRTLY